MPLRIATFNLENWDDVPNTEPTLAERIQVVRPQLLRLNADVLCLQEVHSQGVSGARTFAALDALLAGTDYAGFHRANTHTADGQPFDVRNLIMLSRFPFAADPEQIRPSDGPRPRYQMATADPPDATADLVDWERPMLYGQIDLGATGTLHLINVHLKSKLASTIPGQKIDTFTWRSVSAWAEGSFISSMKRVGQALQARLLIDRLFDDHGLETLIGICGDFNSTTDEVPLQAICGPVEETGNPAHGPRLMVPCENNIPDSARYSLFHLGHGQMLDHIVVSRPMLRFFRGAEIHNEALPDESGAFRTDTKFPESDHAPVVAAFDITL
jgi:predicted extracellular nuclease